MDDEPKIEIPLYVSGRDHPITILEGIEHVSLQNTHDHEKMRVTLDKIVHEGSDVYLNQTYDMYTYFLLLPSFDQTFIIEDALMIIDLKNGITYDFSIGKLSISPSKPLEGHLDWSKLSGIKIDQSIFERIGCVEIGIYELNGEIIGFFDGFKISNTFQIKDNILYLYIDNEPFIYQSFPIEIIFRDGTSQQIPYFIYMNSYQLLKMSGPLIHHYDLNSAM
jgi:hypothetical protein